MAPSPHVLRLRQSCRVELDNGRRAASQGDGGVQSFVDRRAAGGRDPEGYANFRAKTTMRIPAIGEREWPLEQFERVLATGTSMSSASIPVAPRASRDLRRLPNDANSIAGKPTLMPGRRRSSARQGWRFRLITDLQSVRAQAAAQSDAARSGDQAVRTR